MEKLLPDLLRFWDFLLEFYVRRNGCRRQPVAVGDVDREHEQAAPGPDNSRRRREATGGDWPQVVDGEIGCRYAFVRFKLRNHCKGGGRIDQGSHRAAMHQALVLFQIVANFKMKAGFAAPDRPQFEAEKLGVWN